MNFIEYPDREMTAFGVADTLASALKTSLLTHETASFAVAGGTTPSPIFDTLCAVDLDWGRVHVMATDERWVPQDDPRSNAGLIRARLLTGRASEANEILLYAPTAVPEDALEEIAARVEPQLPLSVLLLGMGEDMHTASLFPGGTGLKQALKHDAPPVVAMRTDAVPEPRISLSAPVLNGALSKHLVIYGAAKRTAFEQAMSLPPLDAPIQAVLDALTVHWAE